MPTLDERVAALEQSVATITGGPRVHPVRDELTSLRDAYGARLAAIEARLTSIEGDLTRGFEDHGRWLRDIDEKLDRVLAAVTAPRRTGPPTRP